MYDAALSQEEQHKLEIQAGRKIGRLFLGQIISKHDQHGKGKLPHPPFRFHAAMPKGFVLC